MDLLTSVQMLVGEEELVIHEFYTKLLKRSDDARELFHGVDMEVQAAMLTNALTVVELQYTTKSRVPPIYLRRLGEKHEQIGVPKRLYPVFGECLLETLAEFHGEEWDEELQTKWTEAIDLAVERMIESYQQHD